MVSSDTLRIVDQREGRRAVRLLGHAVHRLRHPRVVEPEPAFDRDRPVPHLANGRRRRRCRRRSQRSRRRGRQRGRRRRHRRRRLGRRGWRLIRRVPGCAWARLRRCVRCLRTRARTEPNNHHQKCTTTDEVFHAREPPSPTGQAILLTRGSSAEDNDVGDKKAVATIAVKELSVARKFYEGTLGLGVTEEAGAQAITRLQLVEFDRLPLAVRGDQPGRRRPTVVNRSSAIVRWPGDDVVFERYDLLRAGRRLPIDLAFEALEDPPGP